MKKLDELLELYNVKSMEELKELLKNGDEKVKNLIEFINYYNEKEGS